MPARTLTQGSITRQLIGLTLPLLLGNLIQQFYNTVDMMIVGQVAGELLHPVFAADGDAGGDGGADGVAGLHLGGGTEGNFRRIPSGGPGRGLYFLPHGLNPFGQRLFHINSKRPFHHRCPHR